MNILAVMANSPFRSQTGSGMVAYHTIKHLSQRHKITLIYLSTDDISQETSEFAYKLLPVQHKKNSSLNSKFTRVANILACTPPSLSAHSSKEMNKQVAYFIDNNKVDAVLLFEFTAIQYIPTIALKKTFANIEDPQSLKLAAIAQLPIWSSWQRFKIGVLAFLTARYEKKILNKLAEVHLLSQADVAAMETQSGARNLVHIPYGVQQDNSAKLLTFEERDPLIVFSGSMFHPANIDAAIHFITDIFPYITEKHPAIKLMIVGADPDNRIIKAAQNYKAKIEITGKVSSIASYIRRAVVSVCPIRVKIGVQTKVLEAMSLGTPVVATSAGNSGIGGISGIHLWIEDDPREFAQRVNELLSGVNWDKLSATGKLLADKSFDWRSSTHLTEERLLIPRSS